MDFSDSFMPKAAAKQTGVKKANNADIKPASKMPGKKPAAPKIPPRMLAQ